MACVYEVLNLYVPVIINNDIDSYMGIHKNKNFLKWINFESKKHRLRGPAVLLQDKINMNIFVEKYYYKGVIHRLNCPAIIKYYRKSLSYEEWRQNGAPFFIPEGPWYIQYKNGYWSRHSFPPHRIEYNDKGEIEEEMWCYPNSYRILSYCNNHLEQNMSIYRC